MQCHTIGTSILHGGIFLGPECISVPLLDTGWKHLDVQVVFCMYFSFYDNGDYFFGFDSIKGIKVERRDRKSVV